MKIKSSKHWSFEKQLRIKEAFGFQPTVYLIRGLKDPVFIYDSNSDCILEQLTAMELGYA